MTRTARIALLQHACVEDKAANIKTMLDQASEAAAQGVDLIVTQELFAGLYFPQVENGELLRLAEAVPAPGQTPGDDAPTAAAVCEAARSLHVAISASLFEKRAPGLFHNTTMTVDASGAVIGRYRKMHIPDDPRFYEKFYFTPGDLGFQSVDVGGMKAGTLVCWDQWYPEAARLTTMRGAEVLLYPTAIGWHKPNGGGGETEDDCQRQRDAWRTIQRSHAIANGVFVAACNRYGQENELRFWGGSFVADPTGRVIAEAPENEPAVLLADLDLTWLDRWREGWPFLRDRRVDAYGDLTQRYLD